jgi:hypothetical protein
MFVKKLALKFVHPNRLQDLVWNIKAQVYMILINKV